MKLEYVIPCKMRVGKCYENAFRFLVHNQEWTLVHGVCVGTGPENMGQNFGHAWLEKSESFQYEDQHLRMDFCLDPRVNKIVPKTLFYLAGQISYVRRYSFEEATDEAYRTKMYGPWDERVAAAAHRGGS